MQNYKNLFLILVLFTVTYEKTMIKNDVSYESCLHVLNSSRTKPSNGKYWIQSSLSTESVQLDCDFDSYGGGWTLIGTVDESYQSNKGRNGFFVDDHNLQYTEVMWKILPGFFATYYNPNHNAWYDGGFSLMHGYLKFNNFHYYFNPGVGPWRGCGAQNGASFLIDNFDESIRARYIDSEFFQNKQQSSRCQIDSRTYLDMCSEIGIVRAMGRFSGFGDLENSLDSCSGDNNFRYNIAFYVR